MTEETTINEELGQFAGSGAKSLCDARLAYSSHPKAVGKVLLFNLAKKLLMPFRGLKGQAYVAALILAQLSLLVSIDLKFSFLTWFGIAAQVGDATEYLSLSLFTFHMPLYSMLFAPFTLIVNPVAAAIIVNVACFIGFGIVTCYLSGRKWVGLVCSFFPYFLLKYSMYVYSDIAAVFFAAIGFYFMRNSRAVAGLFFGLLAVASHYLAILLIPGFVYLMYLKRRMYAPFGLIPSAPFVALSLFRFFQDHDLLFYLRLNFVHWGGQYGFFSYPFASGIYVLTHLSDLWSNPGPWQWLPFGVLYATVIFFPVYAIYWTGAYLAYRASAHSEIIWALPVLLFVTFLSPFGFYYVPRYIIFAFPFLVRVGNAVARERWLKGLLALITTGNVVYGVASLLLFPLMR